MVNYDIPCSISCRLFRLRLLTFSHFTTEIPIATYKCKKQIENTGEGVKPTKEFKCLYYVYLCKKKKQQQTNKQKTTTHQAPLPFSPSLHFSDPNATAALIESAKSLNMHVNFIFTKLLHFSALTLLVFEEPFEL